MFRRARYAQVIDTQLDLFERDNREVIDEAAERLEAYNRAGRDEAEELYGDYLDAVETGTTLDFSELFRNPIVPARIRLRPLPPRRLSCDPARIRVIHSRRRRSARLTLADGVRRIIRGRAPPLCSTCPL